MLLVVLGGGCGFVGRNAVDSLGGDGKLWLNLWYAYVGIAAMSTWRASWVCGALSAAGPVAGPNVYSRNINIHAVL